MPIVMQSGAGVALFLIISPPKCFVFSLFVMSVCVFCFYLTKKSTMFVFVFLAEDLGLLRLQMLPA